MSFENYLDTQLGINGIPLSYIIHKDNNDPDRARNEHEKLIWTAPLYGQAFNKDNREVYHILKDRVLGTEGWAWFQGVTSGDGRADKKRITEHYFGTSHTNRSAAESESRLSKIYYRNESYFPFDKYISKLTEIFQDLEDANEPKTERQKVNIMLNQVQSTNPEVIALKTTIRHSYPEDFIGARDAMAAQIASIFPGLSAENKNKRRTSSASMQKGGHGHWSNPGRGRGLTFLGNIDVTNPSCNFSKTEWEQMKRDNNLEKLRSMRRGSNGKKN